MFGSKKIYAQILNNKLVCRIGGGFSGIEEFIKSHGETELQKMKRFTPQQIADMHTPIPQTDAAFSLKKDTPLNMMQAKMINQVNQTKMSILNQSSTPASVVVDLTMNKKKLKKEVAEPVPEPPAFAAIPLIPAGNQ